MTTVKHYKCSKCSIHFHNNTLEEINAHRSTHKQSIISEPDPLKIENKVLESIKKPKTDLRRKKKKMRQLRYKALIKENEQLKVKLGIKKKQPKIIKRSYDPFYDSNEWIALRHDVLKRDGRTCVLCGVTGPGVELHVDHIKPRSKYPMLALDPNNLQVLCKHCNLGKSNRDDTDWRYKK